MRKIFRLYKFFVYQWQAKSKYYLHSPFVYQFFLHVIEVNDDCKTETLTDLRKQLSKNHEKVQLTDYGTGHCHEKKISDLINNVAIKAKYGELLYRLVSHFQPLTIIELGTSIGISSSYLALANDSAKITTIDGSAQLIDFAQKCHRSLRLKNVTSVVGSFEDVLPGILEQLKTCDLIFFDGNHTHKATLNYFEQCLPYTTENTIFVFDDIYWSNEMSSAWNIIKQHPSITLTIDVYQFGICFFRKENLAKENFVLRY